MNALNPMNLVLRLFLVFACLSLPQVVWAGPDATIFRIFMLDGSAFVSYGVEFSKLSARFGLTPADRAKLGDVDPLAFDPALEFLA